MDQEEQNVQETAQEHEQQEKMFTQSEVDRIVTDRVKRSEDRRRDIRNLCSKLPRHHR